LGKGKVLVYKTSLCPFVEKIKTWRRKLLFCFKKGLSKSCSITH